VSGQKELYAVSMAAMYTNSEGYPYPRQSAPNTYDGQVSHSVSIMAATSKEEATGMAYITVLETFPPTKGYRHHSVVVMPVANGEAWLREKEYEYDDEPVPASG
jgi:hypothetical protein